MLNLTHKALMELLGSSPHVERWDLRLKVSVVINGH